ncbi:MAG TPA: phosphatase PAP2 family protein [Gaiellaceae bacterium]|nr:phosphatase PAP2 family protein [Gaiellaceae bacterium]
MRRARLRRPTRADVLRATPVVVYAGLLAWLIARLHGLPASREVLVIVVLAGIFAASATSIGRLRRLVLGIAFDWFPFVVMLALYDLIRGYADGLWLPTHARPQIEVDRALGLGSVPTVWLQHHLWHGGRHLQWYDYAAWLTYASYFFVPTLVLAVLWWRSRSEFRRLAWMVVALAFAGCATYVLFPAVPPWLAGQEGLIPPVHHVIAVVSAHTPVISFKPLWKRGTLYANNVAAVPSLHAAYTMLIALFLVDRARSRWRYLLWLYPAAMAFALVYSGEHYLVDVLLGWIYALAVFAVGTRRRLAPAFFSLDAGPAGARVAQQPVPLAGDAGSTTV